MTELQTECEQGEQINKFLANKLDAPARQAFVAHLGICEDCAALLRDLREDERLARVSLTAEERSQIQVIVSQARLEVAVRLGNDRRRQEESSPPRPAAPQTPAPQFAPPRLGLPAQDLWRVVWLALAAATALALAGWWFLRG